jgi:hypothetical protein
METNDSVRYANKAVTLSFWAKAGANYSSTSSALTVQWTTGTGTNQRIIDGYTGASNITATTATLTTSWQRFSYTGTAASNTNEMGVLFANTPVGTAGANDWFEVTGVQIEFGSVATNFKRAGGGTLQGELAACQRYYYRTTGATTGFLHGFAYSTTAVQAIVPLPVTMRVFPTGSVDFSNIGCQDIVTAVTTTPTAITLNSPSPNGAWILLTGMSGLTTYRQYTILSVGVGYLGFSAEL